MIDFDKTQGSVDGDTITVKSDQLEIRITNKNLAKRVADKATVFAWSVEYALADVLGVDTVNQFVKEVSVALDPPKPDEIIWDADTCISCGLQWEGLSMGDTREDLVAFYSVAREFTAEGRGAWPTDKVVQAIDLALVGKLVEAYALAREAAIDFYGDSMPRR
jgi:hypothetical protein